MRLLPNGFVKTDKKERGAEENLIRAFSEVAEKNGYDYTLVSSVYPISESFFNSENRYKLLDREGELLCLIDDAVIGLLNATDGEINRLYTSTEVYRYRGQERNTRQCAALLTGVVGLEGEAELILLGLEIAKTMGISGGKVAISSTYVLQGLAEVFFGYRPDPETIRSWAETKPKTDADGAMYSVLEQVKSLKGKLDVVRPATDILTNKVSGLGLSNVLDFYDVLCGLGLEDKVEIDFSIIGRNYDSGSVFEIRDGSDNVIFRGGRHDFSDGAETVRAVSFTMCPKELLIPYEVTPVGEKNVVIGVADGIKALSAAYQLRQNFIAADVSFVTLYRVDKERVKEYADAYEIETAVYVDEEGNLSAEK